MDADGDDNFFSADAGRRFCGGPPTHAPVARVRDVVLCVTNGTSASLEEFQAHPPIAGAAEMRASLPTAGAVELGRGIRIDRLPEPEADLVINACTPRGHYFFPVHQFGQRYTFVREVDLAEWERHRYNWDPDRVLWDALVLSRFIRDNGYSTEFAARIADFEDGQQCVVYTLDSESKHVYRLRDGRDWLDADEGRELRDVLATYWHVEASLPGRVRRAIWRLEFASWLYWGDLVVPILVSGLEALVSTGRDSATSEFVTRVPALAVVVGVDGVSRELCRRMYGARSAWMHGSHVRLFATGPERERQRDAGMDAGPANDEQRVVLRQIALLQDVLRAAVRRCIEDQAFREIFDDPERIRAEWPIPPKSA